MMSMKRGTTEKSSFHESIKTKYIVDVTMGAIILYSLTSRIKLITKEVNTKMP